MSVSSAESAKGWAADFCEGETPRPRRTTGVVASRGRGARVSAGSLGARKPSEERARERPIGDLAGAPGRSGQGRWVWTCPGIFWRMSAENFNAATSLSGKGASFVSPAGLEGVDGALPLKQAKAESDSLLGLRCCEKCSPRRKRSSLAGQKLGSASLSSRARRPVRRLRFFYLQNPCRSLGRLYPIFETRRKPGFASVGTRERRIGNTASEGVVTHPCCFRDTTLSTCPTS